MGEGVGDGVGAGVGDVVGAVVVQALHPAEITDTVFELAA